MQVRTIRLVTLQCHPSKSRAAYKQYFSIYDNNNNNKFVDCAMVRHSSDESEAPVMAGDYSKAIEKRCA